MKAGVVQGLFALSTLSGPSEVAFLVTTDEEFGAPTSRSLIEDLARTSDVALVLEPAVGDALKVARKGVSVYEIEAHGRAAHSGLDPEAGRSALIEIAHQILALEKIARPTTTVTPTLATAGSAANTVPAHAKVTVDVRSPTPEEQERVHAELMDAQPVTVDVAVTVRHKLSSPPFPRSASTELFEKARRVASSLGIASLVGAEVGGGSDGNYTAGVGTPTLDGLGPVGDGAHAEGEHVVIEHMPTRAALVAALVSDLIKGES
jgi:glutamate carboxypeptidase